MARLEEWATRMGFEIFAKEIDKVSGKDAKKASRRGQERLMSMARGHHLHAIATAKVDRWARSMQYLSTTVNELHSLGVDFYIVDQGITVRKSEPTSVMIMNILGAVAEWEGSIISERTREGLVGKVGKGRHAKGCGVDFTCPTGVHTDAEP